MIAVILSSALSGTYGNAEAAARRFDAGRVTVVDSRNVTLGEGLLVVRGVELAAAGWSAEGIVKGLQRVRAQSGGFSPWTASSDWFGPVAWAAVVPGSAPS